MKKLLLLPIFAALIFSCSSDDDGGSNNPNEDDTCIDCETTDFDFSICDESTYAEVTITDENGTINVEKITYGNGLDYETLTGMGCEQLNELYVSNSSTSEPGNTCLECEASDISVNVCENEDEESYTLTYQDKSVSFDYEAGETFDSLNCFDLYAKGLELLNTTN